MAYLNQFPHRDGTMYGYEKLIIAIEQLEKDGIINFDDFENLPYYEIQKQYFSMPNPTMIAKVKIMIRDKRNGKEGLSEFTTVTHIYKDGKPVKKITKTDLF